MNENEQLTDVIEICRLFDKDNDETIYQNDLIDLIKALGIMFTDTNVKLIEEFQDSLNNEEKIPFDNFLEFYEKVQSNKKPKEEEEKELLTAFEFFDGENKGYIEAEYFKKAIMCFGNKLTEDEVNTLFNEAVFDKTNKNFNYRELAKVILENK